MISGSSTIPLVSSLNCSGLGVSATPIVNTNYSATATIGYTDGNGVAYPTGTVIPSTGVAGLSATLQGSILSNGSGNLFFYISGIPASAGTASFTLNFGGHVCSFGLNVFDTIYSIVNVGNRFDFVITPNPVNNNKILIKIISPIGDNILNACLYDELGRVVMNWSENNLLTSEGQNITQLANGIYIIKITDKKLNVTLSKKFVKSTR